MSFYTRTLTLLSTPVPSDRVEVNQRALDKLSKGLPNFCGYKRKQIKSRLRPPFCSVVRLVVRKSVITFSHKVE